jgi:hypothetical protein
VSVSPPVADRRAYVHVGAPKTGSTFLQGLVWRHRRALREQGLDMLGDNQGQHYRAGKDLRGVPFDAHDPGVDWSGAWERMAARAEHSPAPAVLVSDEHLASLTPDQCRRAQSTLAPREVHVVYVLRDLAGLLPSEWQEFVKHGSRLTFEEWSRRVLLEPRAREARWFWSVHDPVSVVQRWSAAVPVENIHVIAMPPRTAPRDELWRRFASVVQVDPGTVADFEAQENSSLGLAAAEVLRRVNGALPDEMPAWHRTGVVRDLLANQVLNPLGGGGRPRLPDDLARLVEQRGRDHREVLPTLGCQVVGELPEPRGAAPGDPQPTDAEVADVAVQALAQMAASMGSLRDERRAAERRMREEHARHLADVERSFWDQHPVALRIQRTKERVVASESQHKMIAATMDGYRWARGVVRRDPPP